MVHGGQPVERPRGRVVRVAVVVHPADPDGAGGPFGQAVPRQRRVEVGAMVAPARGLAGVGRKTHAVEVADEVLATHAAVHVAVEHVDLQHPGRAAGPGDREEVGAFPDAAGGAGGAEVAQVAPRLQVVRGVKLDAVQFRQHDGHQPEPAGRIPLDLRVAEFGHAEIEHGIARVLRPRAAAVRAVRDVLVLQAGLAPGGRVDRDEGRLAGAGEAARVVRVDHGTAGKDHRVLVRMQRDGKFFPMLQVGADGMAPADVAPHVAVRIVLVEQVVFAVEPEQAVRIVDPVAAGREMVAGAECRRSVVHVVSPWRVAPVMPSRIALIANVCNRFCCAALAKTG